MILNYRYAGHSGVVNALDTARLAFATNTLRDKAAFSARLADPLTFREALAALYGVVVSDFKYRPKDRLAFQAWMAQQDAKFLTGLKVQSSKHRQRIQTLEARLGELDHARLDRLKPFHKARMDFFNYVYERQYELTLLLDPVITVHPDELSFEAFSRDESTYARLAAKLDAFQNVDQHEFGTTNIDFSSQLHGELERMRSYRETRFGVDPGGFSVVTESAGSHREKKIDLPDSWVQGFLQVHSTMTLSLTRLRLGPVDLFNICRYLKRRKAKKSPRSLRYELTPGQKPKVVIEPWNDVIELHGAAVYEGDKPQIVRTWGRYRLLTIARLLSVCRHVDVYLAGLGMPSIYVCDLGDLVFTLALSGWTDNDWTGGTSARFDLLSRPLQLSPQEVMSLHDTLRERRVATDSSLASTTGLSVDKTRSGLSYLCQVGRAMADLGGGGVFRYRDLFGRPLTIQEAHRAVVAKPADDLSPVERAAQRIVQADGVRVTARRPVSDGYKLSGMARVPGGELARPSLHVGADGQIVTAECTCRHFQQHRLTRGPCEHIVALNMMHMRLLEG